MKDVVQDCDDEPLLLLTIWQQPSIIKSLEQNFGDRAMKERLSLTPGTP